MPGLLHPAPEEDRHVRPRAGEVMLGPGLEPGRVVRRDEHPSGGHLIEEGVREDLGGPRAPPLAWVDVGDRDGRGEQEQQRQDRPYTRRELGEGHGSSAHPREEDGGKVTAEIGVVLIEGIEEPGGEEAGAGERERGDTGSCSRPSKQDPSEEERGAGRDGEARLSGEKTRDPQRVLPEVEAR